MTAREPIIRIAAKGDGVTASGRHVRGAVTGDVVTSDGAIEQGPHHTAPLCQHFERCGGCDLQYADDAALAQFVEGRVVHAIAGQGVQIGEVLPTHLSPPATRRRAKLHALSGPKGVTLGYREGRSHKLIDLAQCPVLDPRLFNLVAPLREFLKSARGPGKKRALSHDCALTLCDQGVDLVITNLELDGLQGIESALDFARDNNLARLSIDTGFGPENLWEPAPVTHSVAGLAIGLPHNAFLQATPDAEARMIDDAREFLGEEASKIADLFSGLGTFAFGLREGRRVLAAEADQAAHLACKAASQAHGAPVYPVHRDLFRNPLRAEEIDKFDAILLDPPRAGARAQVDQIAQSRCARIVYASCNPSSFARDAACLTNAGFSLSKIRPIGQFRWSTHVEMIGLFER